MEQYKFIERQPHRITHTVVEYYMPSLCDYDGQTRVLEIAKDYCLNKWHPGFYNKDAICLGDQIGPPLFFEQSRYDKLHEMLREAMTPSKYKVPEDTVKSITIRG